MGTPEYLGKSIVSCIRSDRPDGLYTTVVVNRLGVALGLVYSSKESIVEAVKIGQGVYYSRSRKGLWSLQETLMRRKVSAPPKSYTKRLFENPQLLRQKLLEEA